MAIHYKAEVIGSLRRPEYLEQAREWWEAKEISTHEFKHVEDRAVDEMITLQEHCGLAVITDGEMRRTHFIAPLTDVISGIKPIPAFSVSGGVHTKAISPVKRPRSRCNMP